MASTRKKTISKLSPERTSSKDLKADFSPELIEFICQAVSEKLQSTIENIFQREVSKMIAEMKATFETRVTTLEKTLSEVTNSLEIQQRWYEEKVDRLNQRVNVLEGELHRQRTETNLVIAGIPESEGTDEEEETTKVVLDVMRSTLGLSEGSVSDADIVSARRLGKKQNKAKNSRARPRRILVRTRSKAVRDTVMSTRFSAGARSENVFLNEDLSVAEQRNRRKFLPLYRVLRSHSVQCRLDRGSLVVKGNVFFDLDTARKSLLESYGESDLNLKKALSANAMLNDSSLPATNVSSMSPEREQHARSSN